MTKTIQTEYYKKIRMEKKFSFLRGIVGNNWKQSKNKRMKENPTSLENLSDDQLEELRQDMVAEFSRRNDFQKPIPPKDVIARLKKLQKHFEESSFTVKVEGCIITIRRYYDGYYEVSEGLCYDVVKFKGPKIFASILHQDVVSSEIKRIAPEIYKEDVALAKEYKKLSDQYSNWTDYA